MGKTNTILEDCTKELLNLLRAHKDLLVIMRTKHGIIFTTSGIQVIKGFEPDKELAIQIEAFIINLLSVLNAIAPKEVKFLDKGEIRSGLSVNNSALPLAKEINTAVQKIILGIDKKNIDKQYLQTNIEHFDRIRNKYAKFLSEAER